MAIENQDDKIFSAVYWLQPNASGAAILAWLNENHPLAWWKFWGWMSGDVYVSLLRMEQQGRLTSQWSEGEPGQRRRLYRLRR